MKTCCPLPTLDECIKKDIRYHFVNALEMIVKCEPNSDEFDFYKMIIDEYADYMSYCDDDFDNDD